jgi:hypothetical protein
LKMICAMVTHQHQKMKCFWHVQEIMRSDRQQSVDQTASENGISFGSCHSILHDVLNVCNVWYLEC